MKNDNKDNNALCGAEPQVAEIKMVKLENYDESGTAAVCRCLSTFDSIQLRLI